MRIFLLALLLASFLTADEPAPSTPKLLLSAKLLRRLKRDRERQTVRWVNFENRVKNVADSPERGFELALYFAIGGDDATKNEAIAWASAHPCEHRQRALISDWVGPLPTAPCPNSLSLRDQAFQRIAAGLDTSSLAAQARTELVPQLAAGNGTPEELYSLLELLFVLRANNDVDIRDADPTFFRKLPTEFLLSLKPDQVERPTWMAHIAALALITVDPNLEGSQFLQGWAMEDRQTLREGPGVAYELLWADPYLPGIAYQNLDPWVYNQEAGRLFARSDWTKEACWIAISKMGIQEVNCPTGWRDKEVHFGALTLMPMAPKCMELIHLDAKQDLVVWQMRPGQPLVYGGKKEVTANADITGLWHPGTNVEGKVCRR